MSSLKNFMFCALEEGYIILPNCSKGFPASTGRHLAYPTPSHRGCLNAITTTKRVTPLQLVPRKISGGDLVRDAQESLPTRVTT